MTNEKKTKSMFEYAVERYYGTFTNRYMPILLLYLAMEDKLHLCTTRTKHNPTPTNTILYTITLDEVERYSHSFPGGRNLYSTWKADRTVRVDITAEMNDETLQWICHGFKTYDTRGTGLVNSMYSNTPLQNDIEIYFYVQQILSLDKKYLKDHWIETFYYVYDKSGIAPRRERLKMAQIEQNLIGSVKGYVYHPYASVPFIGTLLDKKEKFVGDIYKEIDRYTTQLLFMGAGIDCFGIGYNDSEKNWRTFGTNDALDCIICNSPDQTVKCLCKARTSLSPAGKFVGIVQYKLIDDFLHHPDNQWILTEGKLSKIIKLDGRQLIIFVDMALVGNRKVMVSSGEDGYQKEISLAAIKKKTSRFYKLLQGEMKERKGFDLVRIGDDFIFEPKEVKQSGTSSRSTAFHLLKPASDERIASLDDSFTEVVNTMWRFGYLLPAKHSSLITSNIGDLSPKVYKTDKFDTYYDSGCAFNISSKNIDPGYLTIELSKYYVKSQLNPLSMADEEVIYSPDDILDLKIYVPQGSKTHVLDRESELVEEAKNNRILLDGFKIIEKNSDYTIHYTILDNLSEGSFGVTYQVSYQKFEVNASPEAKPVEEGTCAIKEFMPLFFFSRDPSGKVFPYGEKIDKTHKWMKDFDNEYEKIRKLNKLNISHIMQVGNKFSYPPTNTIYYTMPFYENGSVEMELQEKGRLDYYDVMDNYILPVAHALFELHANNMMHWDVKPENITIDSEGKGVLIDFGLSRNYTDNKLSEAEKDHQVGGTKVFYPIAYLRRTEEFDPFQDIYALGVTIVNAVTNDVGSPIIDILRKHKISFPKTVYPVLCRLLDLGFEERARREFASVADFIHKCPGYEDELFQAAKPKPKPKRLTKKQQAAAIQQEIDNMREYNL